MKNPDIVLIGLLKEDSAQFLCSKEVLLFEAHIDIVILAFLPANVGVGTEFCARKSANIQNAQIKVSNPRNSGNTNLFFCRKTGFDLLLSTTKGVLRTDSGTGEEILYI